MINFRKYNMNYFKENRIRWILTVIVVLAGLAIIMRAYISYQNHQRFKDDLYVFIESQTDNSGKQPYSPSTLTQWNIFGKPQFTDNRDSQLVLLGTFVSTDPQLHFAILSEKEGAQMTYYMNQPLPGGGYLREISDDHVIIELNGRRIMLKQPHSEHSGSVLTDDRLQQYVDRLKNLKFEQIKRSSYLPMFVKPGKASETKTPAQ